MNIDILTLFPDMFESVLGSSIIGRAREKDIIRINIYNIRQYANNKHRHVDDYPYGGGRGMVLSPQPLFDAFNNILGKYKDTKPRVIYFSPQGKVLNQATALNYSRESSLVLLCGHYEGVDQRVLDRFVDDEISIGDYVLTGGEIPAMAFVDCISRLIPGVLGNEESLEEESFSNGLLEYPQYTRPQTYDGMSVPDVLISGDHKKIDMWKKRESLKNTLIKRPDIISNILLSEKELTMLKEIKEKLKEDKSV